MPHKRREARLIACALALYRLTLWTYPPAFRRAWGADMLQVFGDICRDEMRCRGTRGLLDVGGTTLRDWVSSLPREYAAQMLRPRGRERVRRMQRLAPAGQWNVRHRNMAGMNRFDRFTERARHVLQLAQEEAQRFNHNYIGTEHLLLGLMRERDGVAAKVLDNLGVDLAKVRGAIEFIVGRGDHVALGEIGMTRRAKVVVELAMDESHRFDHSYLGTEHLLLGLIREGHGIAAGVLESKGVRLETAREATLRALRNGGNAPPTPNQMTDDGRADDGDATPGDEPDTGNGHE